MQLGDLERSVVGVVEIVSLTVDKHLESREIHSPHQVSVRLVHYREYTRRTINRRGAICPADCVSEGRLPFKLGR